MLASVVLVVLGFVIIFTLGFFTFRSNRNLNYNVYKYINTYNSSYMIYI